MKLFTYRQQNGKLNDRDWSLVRAVCQRGNNHFPSSTLEFHRLTYNIVDPLSNI